MGWSPALTELKLQTELYENENVSYTFSYEPDDPEDLEEYTVTQITPSETNTPLIVGNDTISGYYLNCFGDIYIRFLDNDGEYQTVDQWDDIINAQEVFFYNPTTLQYKEFTYEVKAVGDLGTEVTNTYSIWVTNNWTVGRDSLIAAVEATQ